MPTYFVRMPEAMPAGDLAAMEDLVTPEGGVKDRTHGALSTRPNVLVAELNDENRKLIENEGGEVFPDIQFEVVEPTSSPIHGASVEDIGENARFWDNPTVQGMSTMAPPLNLNDVMEHINAPEAWAHARGEGVTIVVVDTGICGTSPEIPTTKRSKIDLTSHFHGDHWNDPRGHGTMCANAATATKAEGGRYNGVAPDATVLSARTTLAATDIAIIYAELVSLKRSGDLDGPVVISNSYGLYVCSPPQGIPANHPYRDVVHDAIDEGMPVVFAAGNNHWDVNCNHNPAACSPNSIWAINSDPRVISVGTVNRDNSNQDPSTPHPNSSRGPGQWASDDSPKPDCVAPTYGEIAWGCGYRPMDWWGTSGACPQVAGLAALILSVDPTLSPADIADIIKQNCVSLNAASTCVGSGLIDCANAVMASQNGGTPDDPQIL